MLGTGLTFMIELSSMVVSMSGSLVVPLTGTACHAVVRRDFALSRDLDRSPLADITNPKIIYNLYKG